MDDKVRLIPPFIFCGQLDLTAAAVVFWQSSAVAHIGVRSKTPGSAAKVIRCH